MDNIDEILNVKISKLTENPFSGFPKNNKSIKRLSNLKIIIDLYICKLSVNSLSMITQFL